MNSYDPKPLLSIVVCCHNSSPRVGDTLDALSIQSIEAEKCEILVVDNDSADLECLKSLIDRVPSRKIPLRLVHETRRGLSHARNCGVAEAKGTYVAFIDDDAIPVTRWAESLASCIEAHGPDVLGGNLIGFPMVPVPRGIPNSIAGLWSLKHFGEEPRWLKDGEYFLGANVVAKRDILLANPFDTNLGRSGLALGGGEELFLGSSKYRRAFVPLATVFHKVTRYRMTEDYLSRRLLAENGGLMFRIGLALRVLRAIGKDALSLIVFRTRIAFLILKNAERP